MGKMMTDKEKERIAIQMLNQGCASRKIQEACKISPNTLVAIRRKLNGVSPPQAMHTKAYRLFETKQPFEVALDLGITEPEASKYYSEYRRLKGLDDLSWLYHTLGHKNITELKSLHRALTQKGVKPVQYATLIKKVDTIENLKSEEEKLGQQNLKIGEEIVNLKQEKGQLKCQNNELKHDNEWIQGQNADLMVENEKLKAENGFLVFQKTSLETTVNKNRIKIENLDKQKETVIRLMCTLEAKVNQLALKKKQLESAINISQANRDDLCEKFIEDAEPYVIESIRDYAGQRRDNFTLVDLMDHPHDFGRVLHYWLKEPTGGLLDTLIHAPSVSSRTTTN